eukprot:scaffold7707_cov72-Cylindrotheca_fusiformis.AAC.2
MKPSSTSTLSILEFQTVSVFLPRHSTCTPLRHWKRNSKLVIAQSIPQLWSFSSASRFWSFFSMISLLEGCKGKSWTGSTSKTLLWPTSSHPPFEIVSTRHKEMLYSRARSLTKPPIGPAPLADLFPNNSIVFADCWFHSMVICSGAPASVCIAGEHLWRLLRRRCRNTRPNGYSCHRCLQVFSRCLEEDERNHTPNGSIPRTGYGGVRPTPAALMTLCLFRISPKSGQVTAGVIRGERSRFQLFGDTMNTASRMESSGERDRIQVTEATADLLTEAGYARWLIPRSTKIYVKGKGEMQT